MKIGDKKKIRPKKIKN